MKKINLIEAITGWLASDLAGDAKGKYHPEEIKIHLNNVFNKSIYAAWLNGKKYSDFSQLDAWSKSHVCLITGQSGAKAYALLPFAPVQLPDGAGIREVRDHANNTNVFAPVEATAGVVFAELDVNTMDSTPTYYLEQSNVNVGAGEKSHLLRLDKLPVPASITSVDVLMVQNIEQMDDFDDVVMPAGSEDDLVRQVIDLMMRKPSPDTNNDGVDQK